MSRRVDTRFFPPIYRGFVTRKTTKPAADTMRLAVCRMLFSTTRLRFYLPHLPRLHEVLRGEFQLTLGLTLLFLCKEWKAYEVRQLCRTEKAFIWLGYFRNSL